MVIELISVKNLMNKIKGLDVRPAISQVTLQASDHLDGFEAIATFRSGDPGPHDVSARGDDPEDALSNLLEVLEQNYGRCPFCGHHPLQEE